MTSHSLCHRGYHARRQHAWPELLHKNAPQTTELHDTARFELTRTISPHMLEQAFACVLHKVKGMIESLCSAIVRVRHLRVIACQTKLGEPSNLGQMLWQARVFNPCKVILVHHQNQVVSVEVVGRDLPGS